MRQRESQEQKSQSFSHCTYHNLQPNLILRQIRLQRSPQVLVNLVEVVDVHLLQRVPATELLKRWGRHPVEQ